MNSLTRMHLAVIVLAAFTLGACGGGVSEDGGSASDLEEVISQTSGDIRIALLNETGDLVQGQNTFRLTFSSAASGEPVDAGTVTVGSSMAMPGMAPMVAPIELESAGATGQYVLEGEFEMSGAWQFEIGWNGPIGSGNTMFSVSVR